MKLGECAVGRYTILERLGEGGTGAVFLCRDLTTDSLVALKEVRASGTSDATSVQFLQLRREASVLQTLSHPNLPQVYDHFEVAGASFLVMDYIQGSTLAAVVAEQGPRTEAQVLDMAGTIFEVLEYLHRQRPPIIFRDLKPSNLMLRSTGQVVFIDFGLSKIVEAEDGTHVPAGGRGLGTRGYSPPEQYGGLTDAASDIYAAGATLYFLLTGVVPPASIDLALGNAVLRPLRELRPDVSASTAMAVERCMALNRADRPAQIADVTVLFGLEDATSNPKSRQVDTTEEGTRVSRDTASGRLSVHRRPGEVLNSRYAIERVVGQGGMGAVYRAAHLELDEPVAIKEMRPPSVDRETREDCIRQFRIEARILNRLRHPNLPRVYDFFEADDHHYLVMDYISGATLDVAPAPSEALLMQWAGELCDVLGYLHRQDPPVIFRDLKPSNIMLAEDNSIRLIDFGIAKVFEADKGATTKTILQGAVSHGYAAPEQYGGGGTDERVDIYALGATLYFLLTRKVPPASMDMMAGIEDFTPLREACPHVSQRLHVAVEWMMSLSRDMRPRSVEEVRQALGLSTVEAPIEASTPVQIRRLLREEFQYFFPAPWMPRGTLLETIFAEVTGEGPPPLVCLVGEAGVGKSRILEELAVQASSQVFVLPPIRGSRITRQQPFGALLAPFRNLLAALGGQLMAALVTRLDDTALHEMGQLFPEFRHIELSSDMTTLAPLERTSVLLDSFRVVLEEVARAFGTEGHSRRLLMWVDDVQWVDSASLRLIDQVLTAGDDVPIAIVMALETGTPTDSLDDAMQRWKRRIRLLEYGVPAFTRQELKEYLLGSLPPIEHLERQVETLHTISGGNALLLEELIRWIVLRRMIEERKGSLLLRELKIELLPSGVGDAVRRRLELLPIDSQELLAVASVIGQHFQLSMLESLSGEKAQVVEESLSRAWEAVFVRPLDGGLWEFVSEATREAFYSRLSATHRRQLHLTLGRMEEQEAGTGAAVAYHFEQAGDVAKSLEHVSRFSKDFMTPTTVEIVIRDTPRSKQWSETQNLSDEQLDKMKQAIAFMTRAYKSLSSYGPHSPVTETSLEMAHTVLTGVQTDLGACSVHCTDGYYRINNRDLEPKQAPPDLVAACRRHHLSGFELKPGLDAHQLREFLSMLSAHHDNIDKDGGWTKALSLRQISCVQVIESVMVEVSEKDLFDPHRLHLAKQVVLKSEEADPNFTFQKTEAPARAPLTERVEEAPVVTVTARDVDSHLESIKGLLEELKASTSGRGQLASDAIPIAGVADKDLTEAWEWLSKQAQREEILRLAMLSRRVDRPLMNYVEERPELLLSEIESPERERRVAAAISLLNHGARARRLLLNYLTGSDNRQGRAVALFLLNSLVQDLRSLLIARLIECTTEEEVVRLLHAMEEGHIAWEGALEVLLRSSSSSVRRATARVLLAANVDMREKMQALRGPLKSENPLVVLDTLLAVTELGRAELVPDVSRVLDRAASKTSSDAVRSQVQACYTLARIGKPDEVMPLLRPIVTRGIHTALLGTWDGEIRAAAAWAIGRLPTDEGRDILRNLLKDADPAVRGVARLALDAPPQDGLNVIVGKDKLMENLP